MLEERASATDSYHSKLSQIEAGRFSLCMLCTNNSIRHTNVPLLDLPFIPTVSILILFRSVPPSLLLLYGFGKTPFQFSPYYRTIYPFLSLFLQIPSSCLRVSSGESLMAQDRNVARDLSILQRANVRCPGRQPVCGISILNARLDCPSRRDSSLASFQLS